jgi:hypothetical protein
MFPTCKNCQKRVKNQKSTNKHLSFDGLIQENIDLTDIYLVVMSPSQNFPARAEPSYEGSEPSRAVPRWGTLISELKPSWIFFLISFNSKVFGTQKKTY